VVAGAGRVERVNREVGGLPTNGRARVNQRVDCWHQSRNTGSPLDRGLIVWPELSSHVWHPHSNCFTKLSTGI
jgi:hypothetical protein